MQYTEHKRLSFSNNRAADNRPGEIFGLVLAGLIVVLSQEIKALDANWPARRLHPVPVPDLSQVESDVRLALEKTRDRLDALISGNPDPGELSEVYGNTGLLYQAHLILDSAAACYRNAALLRPEDYRWPYYLGYLQQQAGRLEQAADAYQSALRLNKEFAVAELRLGGIQLELGRLSQAEPLLRKAAAQPGLEAAALFELGKLAYARRDYSVARNMLLKALRIDPEASRIHYTLALAYRGLGELELARRHMELRGERNPKVTDPLVDLLTGLATGQRMLFHYGMNAAHRAEYVLAARFFQDGIDLQPDNLNARISLARFLYLSGDSDGAVAQLEQVLERAPRTVLANLLLALLLESKGEGEAAMTLLRRALDSDPSHPGVHYFMAGAAMRRGDYATAVRHYEAVMEQDSDNPSAVFWHVVASIKAGASHAELGEYLVSAYRRFPEDPAIGYFYAALLAASPDDTVRDGSRALAIADALYRRHPSLEHGELLAMAYAENGRFEEAIFAQNRVIESAYAMFRFDLAHRFAANLDLYQAERPCRSPWDGGTLATLSPPIGAYKAFEAYPPDAAY